MLTDSKRTWHIIGQGGIGSFCGANLLSTNQQGSKYEVQIVGRRPGAKAKTLITVDDEQIQLPQPVTLAQVESITNVVVAVKAYAVVEAVKQLLPKLAPGANLVLSHNGMGTLPKVNAMLCSAHPVNLYFCTTSSGAHVVGDDVHLVAVGDSYWQAIQVSARNTQLTNRDFQTLFNKAKMAPDLNQILWTKLAINCAINPLTAIEQVKNGELHLERYQQTIYQILQEVTKVAHSQAINLSFETILNTVYEVMSSTAENRSSMLQDLSQGKATEIDYINGYILDIANQHSIQVPTNRALVEKIKSLEAEVRPS